MFDWWILAGVFGAAFLVALSVFWILKSREARRHWLRQLWSARFGGNFVGSPVMYEMEGRQYLLVPAAGSAPGGRGAVPNAPGTTAPLGWVAYALPTR